MVTVLQEEDITVLPAEQGEGLHNTALGSDWLIYDSGIGGSQSALTCASSDAVYDVMRRMSRNVCISGADTEMEMYTLHVDGQTGDMGSQGCC